MGMGMGMGMGQGPGGEPNPYAPPVGDIEFVPAPVASDERLAASSLYSARQIGWAAYLGFFLAGVILLCANYRALGDKVRARRTLWVGIPVSLVVTAILLSARSQAMSRLGHMMISVQLCGFAQVVQGRSFSRHIGAGGKRASHWAMLACVATCVVAYAGLLLLTDATIGTAILTAYY